MLIVSPALRVANNGNWRTAFRWAGFIGAHCRVDIDQGWTPAGRGWPQCMIVLHARKSAEAAARYAESCPDRPLVVVLTGTDLYGDTPSHPAVGQSLDLASHIVVLQSAALDALPSVHRSKSRAIYQSAPALARLPPCRRSFDVVSVGHMRAEKDPLTPMRALKALPDDSRVRLIQIGDALQEEYAIAARETEAHAWPGVQRYRWLGGRPHGETRRRIRQARAMLVASVMEGGANVIVEAVTCGVPVIASRISGNLGMLGTDYDGYFSAGNERELAHLLDRIARDPGFLAHLKRQCAERAFLFQPAREAAEVNRLVHAALTEDPRRAVRPSEADAAGARPPG